LVLPRVLSDTFESNEEGALEVEELLEVREEVVDGVAIERSGQCSGIFLSEQY
jgi:hypothetical protein